MKKQHMEFRHLPINAIFKGLHSPGMFVKVSRDEYRRFLHYDRSLMKADASIQQRTVRFEKVAGAR